MRVTIIATIFLCTSAMVLAGAGGSGSSPAQLTASGWTCFNVPGLGVHCQPPGSGASGATVTLLVFDTSDPNATKAPFKGTELLIHTDLYKGQPCPQEGGNYTDLSGDGLPYFACHHPKGSKAK